METPTLETPRFELEELRISETIDPIVMGCSGCSGCGPVDPIID